MEHDERAWAKAQWGTCELGNTQRDKRAVEIGMRMAAQPGAGLPEQMGNRAMLKGAYRLLNCWDVSVGRSGDRIMKRRGRRRGR